MTLTLHTIASHDGARTKKFRVGRGEGSGRGKTSGRGTKGQRSRSGGRNKLTQRSVRAMLLSFPKKGGFQSRYEKPAIVSLANLSKVFAANDLVDLKVLRTKELIPTAARSAKIVGSGALDKSLRLVGVSTTASAKAAIEKAGGSIQPPRA